MEKMFNRINEFTGSDVRYILLLLLMFFLPSFEALKNISALFFVLTWVYIAKKNDDWGGKWQTIDTIFLFWVSADIIISINAVLTHQLPGNDFRDVLRFVLIGWALSRTNFSDKKLINLVLVTLVAVVLSLLYSYYSGDGVLKELYSVGHINHTAIYLVIAYCISLALLLFNFSNLKNYHKIILVLTTIVFFITTIDTGSRAAFGILCVITLINFSYLMIRVKRLSIIIGFLVLLTFIGISFNQNPPVALKRIMAQDHIIDDHIREKIREFSYYAVKTNPILGVGLGNFNKLDIDDIKKTILKEKGVVVKNLYLPSAHAHNVYYNYLVSGGLLLFSIFTWFWLYVIWIILKLILKRENDWIVFGSVGVVLVNLGIGVVNTTLHHEHAILSMFMLGLLISQYRQSQSRARDS